jgi:hypothetical protein
MAYELILIAGPVWAGRTPPELNTFLDNLPDAIGRRFGVFATAGSGRADGWLRSAKNRVERAGGMIVYEDCVKRSVATKPSDCARRAGEIVDQLLRPSVWS